LAFAGLARRLPARVPARVPSVARAAEGDEAGPSPSSKTPIAELQVGQSFDGKISKRWRTVGCFVDIGVENEGMLEVGEMRDGFLAEGNTYKAGDEVKVRVLDVTDGKLFLSMRSGDLSRPPRRREAAPNAAALEGVGPDAWLDGEVTALTTWGAFVAVVPPSGEGNPVVGMVHKTNFNDGFADDAERAVRGGRVKVRVLSTDVETNKVGLSMKP